MALVNIDMQINYIEANIIADYLRRCGINCFLVDEYSSTASYAPSVITARIMVDENDFASSKVFIDDFLNNSVVVE